METHNDMFKKSINNSGIKNMIDMYNEMNFWLKLSQECNITPFLSWYYFQVFDFYQLKTK